MANPKKRVPENVPGDFFVDSTCIGASYWAALATDSITIAARAAP